MRSSNCLLAAELTPAVNRCTDEPRLDVECLEDVGCEGAPSGIMRKDRVSLGCTPDAVEDDGGAPPGLCREMGLMRCCQMGSSCCCGCGGWDGVVGMTTPIVVCERW